VEPGKNNARIVVIEGQEAVEIEQTRGLRALVELAEWDRGQGTPLDADVVARQLLRHHDDPARGRRP
jgi:hypothetical protein